MERVSNERLAELISSDEAWRDNSGELDEDERRWYEDRIAALTELREMRKVLGAVDEFVQVRPSINISHDLVNEEFIATSGACKALGRDALSALAALVERGEA